MQIIKINMVPSGVNPMAFASQYDDERLIRFVLYNGEGEYILNANETVHAEITKPDGTLVSIPMTNDRTAISDLVLKFEDCDQAGICSGEVVITDIHGHVTGSLNFILKIEEDTYGSDVTTLTATGNPCTFTTDLADALVSLTADIVAKQDLHGYDHPWAGGAGKNKIDVSDGSGNTMRGVTPAYDNDGGLTFIGTVTEVGWCGSWNIDITLPAGTYTFSISNPEIDHNITFALDWSAKVVIDRNTASKTVTFNQPQRLNRITLNSNDADVGQNININVKDFQIELGSTATAYEPYSNICPIVGHTELNLTRCGKNLFDKTTTIDDNWINSSGLAVYFAGGFYSALIPVKPNTAYYLSNVIGGNDFVSSVHFDNDMNVIGIKNVSGSGIQSGSITTFNNSAYMRINSNTASKDTVMVSEGSTATAYEPYNGQTFTVAFGQTVYGGHYDKSGRLTIDTVKVVLDGSQPIGLANWNPNTNTRAWIYLLTTFPDLKDYEITDLNISSCKLKADKLKTVTYQGTNGIYSNDIPSISIVGGDYWSIAVRVNDTTLENDTAINNYLSQNPIEVIYELATPIVIDVQAISVSAENGVNNIVSDCGGDVSVTYIKKV